MTTNPYGHVNTETARHLSETKSPVSGYQGVFSQLVSEQREASALLQKLFAVQGDDERADLWLEVRAALMTHEHAKLQEVYSVIQSYPPLRHFVEEYHHFARTLEDLVGKLDTLPFGVEAWKLTLQHFAATIEVNMAKEGAVVFPNAQQVLGLDKCFELRDRYMNAKRALLTST
jgi:hypothetical protein